MKLNDKFLIHDDGDTKYMVSKGETDFSGIARGSETTEDEIVAKMRKE